MRRKATPRARRSRSRAAALTTVLLTAALGAGCSSNSPSAAGSTPSPVDTSPVSACTKLISYWAKETITGSKWAGLDWEQKGLSNQQYEIMDAIIKNARAEQKQHGLPAAKALIDRQSKDRCTAENGATWSSDNWRPPSEQHSTGP
ncbi:hypothetical protein [Streptomyces sp. NBC_01465]|uniref:hypothetical protein n=1 Tax=Streptomyces sp. NBC_01465 TaxID=2903878 RepID=UPI002E34CAFC|nr:hypothetical protein [Streptomyces sp. NBC_01465]